MYPDSDASIFLPLNIVAKNIFRYNAGIKSKKVEIESCVVTIFAVSNVSIRRSAEINT